MISDPRTQQDYLKQEQKYLAEIKALNKHIGLLSKSLKAWQTAWGKMRDLAATLGITIFVIVTLSAWSLGDHNPPEPKPESEYAETEFCTF